MKSKAIKWLGTLLGCLSLVVVVSAIAGPVNDKCPLSGNAVKKEATYSVGFCCGTVSYTHLTLPTKRIV